MSIVTIANSLWEPVQIGNTLALGRADLHRVPTYLVSQSGHVLTPDVDEDAWNAWHAANVDNPAVKDGRLFAQAQIPSEAPTTTQPTRKRRGG
jgi:hypothetical protein